MTSFGAIKELRMWHRLYAEDKKDLQHLYQIHAIHFVPESNLDNQHSLHIRCIKFENNRIIISGLLWYHSEDHLPLYTVENKHRVLRPLQALERLEYQNFSLDSAHALALVFLNQLLIQTIHVINHIDNDITKSAITIQGVQTGNSHTYSIGVEDLSDIDAQLNHVNTILAHTFNTINDIEVAVRLLREQVQQHSSLDLYHINDLVNELDITKRRILFLIDRQRFHWNRAGESVSNSNLSITKVFSVLWTAFIPGVALINWYGQNFRIMPELSWIGTLPVQLLSVLLLTAIPVWMVKNSGSLR